MRRRFSFRHLFAPAFLTLALAAGGCATQLYDNLSEAEANAIMAVLLDAGIAAEKQSGTEGTYRVLVDENAFARAVRLLDARALPTRRFTDLGEVFGKVAMFSTPMEEQARFLHALQEELANTISRIDGVLDARVHLVLPEQDQLGRKTREPSAAVFVRYADGGAGDPAAYRMEIRRLVSAAVPGLDEEHIVISFFPAALTPERENKIPGRVEALGLRVEAGSEKRVYTVTGLALGLGLLVGAGGYAMAGWLRRRSPARSSGAGKL